MAIAIDRIDYWTPPVSEYYETCAADWWKRVEDDSGYYKHKALPRKSDALPAFETEFKERADRWEQETAIFSAPTAFYLHKDYMVITAKGIENPKLVVPLILHRLSIHGGDWFFALERIAGENPAKDCNDYQDALKAWNDWALRRGFNK